jgi:alpha-L-fucosidase 2
MSTRLREIAWLCILPILTLTPVIEAKSLWSTTPANSSDVIRTAYPLGNGKLGALLHGGPLAEILTLNLDSLWSGGPFNVSNYTGGNPTASVAGSLPGIRDWIFKNGTGNVTDLLGDDRFYGSYRVLGNLSVAVPGFSTGDTSISGYKRSLDLTNGVHTTEYSLKGQGIRTCAFCSYTDQVCVYKIQWTDSLPKLEVRFDNEIIGDALQSTTCVNGSPGNDTAHLSLRGTTQLGPPEGMLYEAIARVVTDPGVQVVCSEGQDTLQVVPNNGTRSVAIVVGAGTDYDPKREPRSMAIHSVARTQDLL